MFIFNETICVKCREKLQRPTTYYYLFGKFLITTVSSNRRDSNVRQSVALPLLVMPSEGEIADTYINKYTQHIYEHNFCLFIYTRCLETRGIIGYVVNLYNSFSSIF